MGYVVRIRHRQEDLDKFIHRSLPASGAGDLSRPLPRPASASVALRVLPLAAALATLLACGRASAQVTDLSVSQKYLKSAGALVPEQGFTLRYTLAAPSPVTITLRRHSAAQGQNPGTLFPGAVIRTVKIPRQAAGARTYVWNGRLDDGSPVTAPIPQADGTTKRFPVSIFTADVQAGTLPVRSLTFSRATGPETAKYQLVPQSPGNVFTIGQAFSLGLAISNLSATPKRIPISFDSAVPQGAALRNGKMNLNLGPLERVSVALPLGVPNIPGILRLSATLVDGAPVTMVTSGGTVPQHIVLSKQDSPFGVAAVREIGAAPMLGARWWRGSWPWPVEDSSAKTKDGAPDSPAGFLYEADRKDVYLASSLPQSAAESADGFGAYLAFMQQMMRTYIRRGVLWQLPMDPSGQVTDYAQRLKAYYTTSKTIHKEALTVMDAASTLELVQALADQGAAPYTDVLAVREVRSLDPQGTTSSALAKLVTLRDAKYPGKEIWNTAEGDVEKQGKPEDAGSLVRATVEQMAGGIDHLFWNGDPDLLKADGTPTPAFFGFSTLTYYLSGAEYVGPAQLGEGVQGYVFQKKGKPILVAWSLGGLKQVVVPAERAGSLTGRDAGFIRANFGRISGEKVALTSTPLFLEGVGRPVWSAARLAEASQRADHARLAGQAAGIEVPAFAPEALTEESLAGLFRAGIDRYKADQSSHDASVNYLFHVNRLADLVSLDRGMSEAATTDLTYRKVMDVANHATADLRTNMGNREGGGYLRDLRTLLRQAEKSKNLGLLAYFQKDYALGAARAAQSTLFAKALIELVETEPLWNPGQELTASK
ncbi:MAG TPA: hypothetical protein VGN26_16305 [Armatimonadota bacterium]|jgi:hypothetical protein